MALSILAQQPTFEENDSDQDLLALECLGDEYEKSLRPSLADKLQIGFLVSDRCTQTDITEIIDIKHMTSTATTLVSELATLKREFEFSKQVIKASFEQKLQDKAFQLYSKLNDRIREMQSIHEERVLVVRRSFKQQLQDALIKMAAHYKKYYEDRLAGKLSSSSSTKNKARIASLEQELLASQSLIQMLQVQLDEARQELQEKPTEVAVPDTTELDAAREETKNLQMELMRLSDKNDELSSKIGMQKDRIEELESEMKNIISEMESERESSRKMSIEIEEARRKADAGKMEAMKILDEQKLALEKEMADKLAMHEERIANSARESKRLLADMESQFELRMLDERRKYELKISELIAEDQRKSKLMENTSAMEMIIEQQRHDIVVLKQRLAKIQKQWEKKFAVLRASMHALKDEAYIRMQLQKQSASLKYASISYGPDTQHMQVPNNLEPQQVSHQIEPGLGQSKPYLPATKPLPAITRSGRVVQRKQTVSLPSGPGTELFPEEEEEEDDMDLEGFVPLPPKSTCVSVGDFMPVANQ